MKFSMTGQQKGCPFNRGDRMGRFDCISFISWHLLVEKNGVLDETSLTCHTGQWITIYNKVVSSTLQY